MWQLHPLAPLLGLQVALALGLWLLIRQNRIRFDWWRHGTVWLSINAALLAGVWIVRLITGSLPT